MDDFVFKLTRRQRCETCKYWQPEEYGVLKDNKFGKCSLIVDFENIQSQEQATACQEKIIVHDNEGYSPDAFTGKNFYCMNYGEKNSKEQK